MANKWLFALFSLLILTNPIACIKNDNHIKATHKSDQNINSNEQPTNRIKRALHAENEKLFIPLSTKIFDFDLEDKDKKINYDVEQPFWGTRGRRDSSADNSNNIVEINSHAYETASKNCENCFKTLINNFDGVNDAMSPFWGNRGRRNSKEVEDDSSRYNPFWGNRGRRQDDEPFWGTRGRREQELPFWGNRGRREGIIIKNEKHTTAPISRNPFYIDNFRGNRGGRSAKEYWVRQAMRDETQPFWGNRGRREIDEPFWGSRGRRKDYSGSDTYEQYEPFWGSRGRRKAALANTIMKTMTRIQHDIENLSRFRRSNEITTPYLSYLDRQSGLTQSLEGILANRLGREGINKNSTAIFGRFKPSESETVLDNRVYAEQPQFILVERSSRSSAEDDPFFISRGKKLMNKSFEEASRGRRGAIEELVKSVRNDPYYIARGKKDMNVVKIGNTTILKEELEKAVDLICSTIDLLTLKDEDETVKREINDSERDRRTILKKLTAQLQVDPYFVSRGKKSEISGTREDNLEAFINQVATMCD